MRTYEITVIDEDIVPNVKIYLPDDVNGDGKVNNKDYGILMQYLNGWDVWLK